MNPRDSQINASSLSSSASSAATTSRRHQKQIDLLLQSRQSSSPHHHARIAAAAARTTTNASSNLSNSASHSLSSNLNLVHHSSTDSLSGAMSQNQNQPPLSSSALNLHPDPPKPSDWTVLDMGGMHIRNLSPSLFSYTFLTTLYLNHNELTMLPPGIGKLKCLVKLDISGNKLESLPIELGLIVSLKDLLVFDNLLTYLPAEFGFLYQLENLGIEGNMISDPVASIMQNEGTSAVITYLRENIPSGSPPQEREWISIEDDFSNPNEVFTLMSYNTLCDKYATPQAYGYTPSWALSWEYRKELLLQDILNFSADIICLQEIETSQFEEYFQEQLKTLGDYDGIFWPKSRARTMGEYEKRCVDGCATFWKASKFSLVEKHLVEFQQIAMQHPDLRKHEDVFNRVMIKDNIAIMTYLESKDFPGTHILIANAHLHWDPSHKDVKLVQTAMMMEELTKLTTKFTASPSKPSSKPSSTSTSSSSSSSNPFPVIVCGDFNSLPESGVYEFLARGSIPQDHPDFGTYQYGAYTSHGLNHKHALRSSYAPLSELAFTNFTPTFKGCIDYIWYGTPCLSVTGVLGAVDKEYVNRTVGFPNAHHPSDHIPLVASFRYKTGAISGAGAGAGAGADKGLIQHDEKAVNNNSNKNRKK